MSADAASTSKVVDPPVNNNIGFRPQAIMAVQPPRQSDLQKAYACIVDDEANPKGWYGSMSASPSRPVPVPVPVPAWSSAAAERMC